MPRDPRHLKCLAKKFLAKSLPFLPEFDRIRERGIEINRRRLEEILNKFRPLDIFFEKILSIFKPESLRGGFFWRNENVLVNRMNIFDISISVQNEIRYEKSNI